MLAMRILTSSGKIYLDYIISKLEEESEARKDHPDATRKLAFNEEDIYDSAGNFKEMTNDIIPFKIRRVTPNL